MLMNIFTSLRYQILLPSVLILLSSGNARGTSTDSQIDERVRANAAKPIAQVDRKPSGENPSPDPDVSNTAPTTEKKSTSQDESFVLKKIEIECGGEQPDTCKIFRPNSPEIRSIVQAAEGKSTTLAEIQNIANKITQLYLNRGYITSRGLLIDQTVTNGVVVIKIIEGGVESIQITGLRLVKPEYVKSRIQLADLTPLNQAKLEDRLRLLRNDPLFRNIEASLRAGTKLGQSILIVRVKEAEPFRATIGIDNYLPPSVGSEQLGAAFTYRNWTVSGDRLGVSYRRSTTGGANLYDFNYSLPLNPTDGSLQFRAAINDYRITDPQLAAFNIRGTSNLYELNYRQPLVRSTQEEFALSLGFTFQDGQTFLFNQPQNFGSGPDANGVSRTSVLKFGQDYIKRDASGAWSVNSQFNFGTGLLNATINNRPTPDGRFLSWLGQGQRLQQLSEDNLLIASLDFQLTPDSLLPSQQFILGGGQSLRGYRQSARYGDNGLRLSIEDRITLQRNESGSSTLQLAPFIDAGVVWNKDDNPNNASLPTQKFLAGVGLGILWEPVPQLNLRVDYGLPLVNLTDRGNNLQDSGVYFSVKYGF
jgi:hemolysin activation/secretion protein